MYIGQVQDVPLFFFHGFIVQYPQLFSMLYDIQVVFVITNNDISQ